MTPEPTSAHFVEIPDPRDPACPEEAPDLSVTCCMVNTLAVDSKLKKATTVLLKMSF